MDINYNEPVENLPDVFDKRKSSNNYKLLKINKDTNDLIYSAIKKLFDVLNLYNADGKTLDDVWGSRIHLQRGKLNDEQYLIKLRTKIMQNVAVGSFPDLVEALAFALQCEKSDIHIVESNTPNKVIIKDIPIGIILNTGFTIDEVTEMVEIMLPVGVSIEKHHYTGTFTYGEINDGEDKEHGYSDLNGEIGGYYGLID